MEILLSLFYFLVFCYVLVRVPFFKNIPGLSLQWLLVFFGLKVLAGFAMIAIYTHIYELEIADFHKYFSDGMIMYRALWENPLDYLRMVTGIDSAAGHLHQYYDQMGFWFRPWESPVYNDNRLVIRFNALVGLFSLGHLGVHNIFINFMSLSGLVALYRFVVRHSDPSRIAWLPWVFFLFPSLLFWGSGILKEGILLFAMGWWTFLLDGFVQQRKIRFLPLSAFILLSLVLVLLKPYTMLFWVPCLFAFYWAGHRPLTAILLRYALVLLGCVGFTLVMGWFFPSYDLPTIIARKQNDFVNLSLTLEAGSIIHARHLEVGFWPFVREFFMGLVYALFRPHPLEVYSPLVLMAVLENLLIWLLIIWAAIRFTRVKFDSLAIIVLSLVFALLLMGFVGMVTPVHGGIVRYKIPALPFLWVAWVHLAQLPQKMKIKL